MVREEIQALNESDTKYEIKASYKSGKKTKIANIVSWDGPTKKAIEATKAWILKSYIGASEIKILSGTLNGKKISVK